MKVESGEASGFSRLSMHTAATAGRKTAVEMSALEKTMVLVLNGCVLAKSNPVPSEPTRTNGRTRETIPPKVIATRRVDALKVGRNALVNRTTRVSNVGRTNRKADGRFADAALRSFTA
jgi:hypothetical protein